MGIMKQANKKLKVFLKYFHICSYIRVLCWNLNGIIYEKNIGSFFTSYIFSP